MADKSVGELIAAQSVTPTDLFVLEQNGTAKKLTGQVLENWLVSFADGHGGIQSIVKHSTSGLVDTYRITLADTTTFDFLVTNGRGVRSITKTGNNGLVDTYTIRYNDNTTDTLTVTNGAKGDKGDNAYVWIKYASKKPTASSHSFGDVADNWIGVYSGESATAPMDWQQYTWFEIKGAKGDTGAAATLTSSKVEYQVSDSGTIIPSGAWSESVAVVPQGKYLWTRVVHQFNTGDPVTSYSVSRMGMDGAGSVSSVANVSPDSDGNVPLTADDVKALPTSGGNMTGAINMNGHALKGLNAPTADDEAANKGYVDANKVDKSRVVNDFTIEEEGFVADARALKVLNDTKLSMELLWENASPTSKFAEQTISLDLSSFKFVVIEASKNEAENNNTFAWIVRIGGESSIVTFGAWENYFRLATRAVTVNKNGIEFGNGYKVISNTTIAPTPDIGQVVPQRIYGIKGVSE